MMMDMKRNRWLADKDKVLAAEIADDVRPYRSMRRGGGLACRRRQWTASKGRQQGTSSRVLSIHYSAIK